MFPEQRGVSGRKLVPQLAIGCVLFTVLGLLATYLVANSMTNYLKTHPFGKPKPAQESPAR